MSKKEGLQRRTFELSDEEIDSFGKMEVQRWTERVMMRLWKTLQDDYDVWSRKLIALGKTLEGWKTFLKEAVHKLREVMTPRPVNG